MFGTKGCVTADGRTEADNLRPLVLSHKMPLHRDGEKLCGVPETCLKSEKGNDQPSDNIEDWLKAPEDVDK